MTTTHDRPAPDGAAEQPGSGRPDRGPEVRAHVMATLPGLLSLALGAWLVIAPFALSYSTTGTGFRAYWNDVMVGIAVIAVAAPQLALPPRMTAFPVIAAVLGGWLIASPFVLGFAAAGGVPRATVNDVLVGILLVPLAVLGPALGRRMLRTDREHGHRR